MTFLSASCDSGVSFKCHQHGKSKVRLGRAWRVGSVHKFVEWNVDITLYSTAERSFTHGDNSSVVATDTMKNTVYVVAKECPQELSPEDFAIRLAKHFVTFYEMVHGTKIVITENPWERVTVCGKPHNHGFKLGAEKHVVEVEMKKNGCFQVVSGIKDMALLKTTQSGFEKFVVDKNTALKDTRERIVASSVLATWKYSSVPACGFSATFERVKDILTATFFGPADKGVYSPAVQKTLYDMAKAVLASVPEVEEVYLNMPNLHFLPGGIAAIGLQFNDDIYVPTSEPHGTIEACVKRNTTSCHCPHSRM